MPGDNPHGTRRIEPCYPAYRWPARFVNSRGSRANLSPRATSEKRLGSIALSHHSHPRASPAGTGSLTSCAAASPCLIVRVLRQRRRSIGTVSHAQAPRPTPLVSYARPKRVRPHRTQLEIPLSHLCSSRVLRAASARPRALLGMRRPDLRGRRGVPRAAIRRGQPPPVRTPFRSQDRRSA